MSEEFYLNVDSRDRINGSISNFNYQYTSRNVPLNQPYKVSLTQLEFPAGCIYQVNQYNNVFKYSIAGTSFTYTAPVGNYTVIEMIGAIQSDITTNVTNNSLTTSIIVSFDPIYNKIGFQKTNNNNVAVIRGSTVHGIADNSMYELLGIGDNDMTLTTTVQYCPNVVDMAPLDYVYLRCNQVYSNSFINNNTQSNDVLYRIQIAADRNNKLYLSPNDVLNNLVSLPSLKSNFNFYITDYKGRLVDLNGTDYSFQIKLINI